MVIRECSALYIWRSHAFVHVPCRGHHDYPTNEEDSFCHTQYICSGDVFEEHNGMMHFVFIAFLYLGITGVTSHKQQ